MVIRRVSPMSCAKIMGVLYAVIGLVIGGIFSLVAMAAGSLGGRNAFPFPMAGALMGAGAIVVLPICYGLLGAIMSAISAVLYNLIAGAVGGIQIDVDAAP